MGKHKHNHKVLSSSHGPAIVQGLTRLPLSEERALNIMLQRHGGEVDGVPFYKLGWALEDNHSSWNANVGHYVYDMEKKTPICFHENQASYHLLAFEPPSAQFQSMVHAGELKGEDARKGTWNCLFHFQDQETGQPTKPTIQLIEVILPVIRQLNEIALAGYRGFDATVQQLRSARIEKLKGIEKKKEADYENYADNLLAEQAPAFEGRPTSFSGTKHKTSAELMPGERGLDKRDVADQPVEFAFSTKSRAPKP